MKLQAILVAPLLHIKGFSAPETKTALERANILIEHGEARGEPPEDPLLLFVVLSGFCLANGVAGNIEAFRDVASRMLSLAEKQHTSTPLVIGHGCMGSSLLLGGEIAEGKVHLDQAIALYSLAEHRPLVTRFGQDPRVNNLVFRSIALCLGVRRPRLPTQIVQSRMHAPLVMPHL